MNFKRKILAAGTIAASMLATAVMAETSGGRTPDAADPAPEYVQTGSDASESPFSTPLTAEEAAAPTGRDTPAPPEALTPADLGFRLGTGWWSVRLRHWGLRKDHEGGRDMLCRLLSENEGRGDVSLTFDEGKLAELYVFWGYDDGWTAADPGAVRQRLGDALRRLGPPTGRWTQKTEETLDGGTVRTYAWYVWHWKKGDLDAVFEIRRTDDATESLRASFAAGAIRKISPDYFEWLGAP